MKRSSLAKEGGQQTLTTDPLSEAAAASASQRPEFFRLPKPRTGGDPYFHFTRSYYYEGEKNGWWRLVRLRQRGKRRGVTLIPCAEVERFIKSQIENGK